ncbi:uncharacterized protein LOC107045099 [Diachasma alloeum]|uniref:uncharacterized protein LOC107045099 n=1 Tax=Diachasma alloeum TaxID=454923 RepID=UPI00073848F6|nr:uncharacterized protein LOC107045099 [Diachasma alloeum]
MMDAPPKYALIKWLGGTDKGKYTPDIPTEWIKDFNYGAYLATDPDDQESYIVKWHEGSEPLGGWPCYDGEIIQLSDRKTVCERLFKTLKGVASPNLKINHDEKHTNNASFQVLNDDPVLNDEDSERSSTSDSEDVNSTPSTELDSILPMSVTQKQLDMNLQESDDTVSQNGRILDRSKSKRSREEPNLSAHVNKKVKGHGENQQSSIDAILNVVTSMQNQIDKLTNKENVLVNVNMSSSPSRNRDDEERDEKDKDVEIGKRGSGVIINKGQWDYAIAQSTASCMATPLNDVLFPYEVLLTSNLRGGARKMKPVAGIAQPERHEARDKKIIKEVFDTVERHQTKTFNSTLVGKASNDHLNYLRAQKRKNDLLEQRLIEGTSQVSTNHTPTNPTKK